MDRFAVCHEITAKWEGGWSNHKADPGGATMFGITQAVYDAWRQSRGLSKISVRNISLSEAKLIYRQQYWKPTVETFQLFPGVDLAVYDASVNSGVSRGIKWLKAAAGSNDHSVTVKKICRARLGFVQLLKTWKTFGKGWGRRIADIEAKGVVMALEAMGQTKSEIKLAAATEVSKAEVSTKRNDQAAKVTATSAAGAGGAPIATDTVAQLDITTIATLGVLAVSLVVLTIVLIARKRAAAERALAYKGTL